MQKLREAFSRFMMGRNGADAYDRFLLIIGLTADIISMFCRQCLFSDPGGYSIDLCNLSDAFKEYRQAFH